MRIVRLLFALLAALPAAPHALAQDFPSKPVRLIIPFPPGGGIDSMARVLGQKMGESMGQPVLVENRPGGNLIVAASIAAKSPPDGYTLMLTLDTAMTQNPALIANLPYDPVRDFAPVSLAQEGVFLFVAGAKSPFKTMGEMVAYAKQNPGRVNIASSNASSQILIHLLKTTAGADVVFVPYKGTAPMMQAVMAGDAHVAIDGVGAYVPNIRQGRLTALATTGPKRHFQLPETPTMAEAGFAQLEVKNWFGIFAPAGTPRAVIARLNAEVVKAVADADLRKRLAAAGQEPLSSTPEELEALLKADLARWTPLIKASGIRLE